MSTRLGLGLCAAVALWLVLLFGTHSDYAVTWDEPAWFAFGETQRAWLSGAVESSLDDPHDFFHYGTLPSIVAATGRWLFHDWLSWMPVDQAWHSGNVLFALVLGAAILYWSITTIGTRGAIFAMLLWCAWPRLWPDWHNNISDLPGAALSLWAAWAAWRCAEDRQGAWFGYARLGLLLGLAYSCRSPNVYVLVGAISIWLVCVRALGRPLPPRLVAGALVVFVAAILTVKGANPSFWHRSVLYQVLYVNPVEYLSGGIGRTVLWFNGTLYYTGSTPWFYAPYTLLLSTPPALLFLGGSSLVRAVRSFRALPTFVLLWLILGLAGVGKHVIGMGNYDGVRHFLEAFAPITLFVAWGVEQWWTERSVRGWRNAGIATAVVVILAFVPSLVSAARIHPYQTGYFNVLAGRIESAWDRFEFDYFGQGLSEAGRWLRAEAGGEPARVYVPFVGHLMDWHLPENFSVIGADNAKELEGAQAGDWFVLANRKSRLVRTRFPFACPDGWQSAHEVRVSASLPAAALVCRRQ